MVYFSYNSDSGFETHDTKEQAMKSANDMIDYYRDNASEGWSDDVESVCWGEVKQQSEMFDQKPLTEDLRQELNISSDCDHYCDYRLTNVKGD